jgi:hypothetical protein
VSYRSAYIKAHYPAEFFWARLRNYGGYHHPAVYIAEAICLGIEVRLPHVNHSLANVVLSWERSPGEQERPVIWLGLGLIRDLRRNAVGALIRARRAGSYVSLRDLLLRVPLQPKEIEHLIQSGALDELGENRPTLLGEARSMARAGSARQLSFGFVASRAAPATQEQRLSWERRLVGYPLETLRAWLPALAQEHPRAIAIASLPDRQGAAEVVCARIPGWHRGGYAIWDGANWAWAEATKGAPQPPTWEPVLIHGRWRADRWGIGWMLVDRWERLGDTS